VTRHDLSQSLGVIFDGGQPQPRQLGASAIARSAREAAEAAMPTVGVEALAAALGTSPPFANRGVSETTDYEPCGAPPALRSLGIDWLTWCFELPDFLRCIGMKDSKIAETLGRLAHDGGNAELIASAILEFYGLDKRGIRLDGLPRSGRLYAHMAALIDKKGNRCGQIEFGGDHTRRKASGAETARVELSGRGCEAWEGRAPGTPHLPRRWGVLRAKLERGPAVWLTRVDIACDLYDGARGVDMAMQLHSAGCFDNRGQRPNMQSINDHGSKKGRTVYIGSQQSAKYLRVYEKGRQLGDRESEWVRWELQIRNAGGAIPLHVITLPAAALRAAYKALQWVSDTWTRCHVPKQRAKSTAANAIAWLRRQYGATLKWLADHTDAGDLPRVVESLLRDSEPAWSREPLHADEWPAVLARALGLDRGDAPPSAA
jgi:phage replication initiation protein